jgi:hypothetical protein
MLFPSPYTMLLHHRSRYHSSQEQFPSCCVCCCSDYMANVCVESPNLIPKFVYCTRSYLGEIADEKVTTASKSYECCDCVGDCTLNPDCACIMRYCPSDSDLDCDLDCDCVKAWRASVVLVGITILPSFPCCLSYFSVFLHLFISQERTAKPLLSRRLIRLHQGQDL